jgi:hypothetical protein
MLQAVIHDVVQATTTPVPPVTDWTAAITIILAALAVLLTALAIMVGGAAIWGYNTIKDEAKRIASQVATEAAEKKLIEYFETEALKDKIKGMVSTSIPTATAVETPGTPYTGEREETDHGNANNTAS